MSLTLLFFRGAGGQAQPVPPPGEAIDVGTRAEFGAKTVAENKLTPFDFSSDLGVGETISSATATSVVWSGTDANPSAMISGVAAISGTIVTQMITGGLVGVLYLVVMTIVTNLSQTLQKSGYLAVTP